MPDVSHRSAFTWLPIQPASRRFCCAPPTTTASLSTADTVSIIIPVYNQIDFTTACLAQLQKTLPASSGLEIIIVDDHSTDATADTLAQWQTSEPRLRVIRQATNRGFIEACNHGAREASNELLIFLNNDTLPQPGWLSALQTVFDTHPHAGAVGGKLIYPDGRLQEAGGIIFNDGSGANIGRNYQDTTDPLFNFVRPVDYCSAALLATPRSLFLELGGFDTHFAPAYYEDTDYAFRLREAGWRVYYQPDACVIHFEGMTSGVDVSQTDTVKHYQKRNQQRFARRWQATLTQHPPPPDAYTYTTWLQLIARPRVQ